MLPPFPRFIGPDDHRPEAPFADRDWGQLYVAQQRDVTPRRGPGG
ncbi:hypothetical protein [Pseudomonas taetrolens]